MNLPLARVAAARVGLAPIPFSLVFELTHRTDFACACCDRGAPRNNEMTRDQILIALAELIALGTRRISLEGGEPLVHPSVDEIVDFLVRRKIEVSMSTNGMLVPRRIHSVRRLSKLKVGLDGPRTAHEAMHGLGSFDKALRGADLARAAGVPVELTCVVGAHNANAIDTLIDLAQERGHSIVFQPGASRIERRALAGALARIEARKKAGAPVANRWSSLRHFRRFPADTELPCAAGWINATLDPKGNLHHCRQRARQGRSANVLRLGARAAFEQLVRRGCSQCWSARTVEENIAWGRRLRRRLPVVR